MDRKDLLIRRSLPVAQLETRQEAEEASEDFSGPLIQGYAAVFNEITDLGPFTESIAPGAFAESLSRGDDVRALFNHDMNCVLGRTTAKTLRLSEDKHGLFTRIKPPESSFATDLMLSIERGDINQMSFGFYIEAEEMTREEEKKTHFTITQARLFDISVVTFPAYEQTEVDVVRQLEMRSRLELVVCSGKAEKEWRDRQLRRLKSRGLR